MPVQVRPSAPRDCIGSSVGIRALAAEARGREFKSRPMRQCGCGEIGRRTCLRGMGAHSSTGGSNPLVRTRIAGMAELAYAPVSKPGVLRLEGSTPSACTQLPRGNYPGSECKLTALPGLSRGYFIICGCGEIGRHAALRRQGSYFHWRFDSSHPHQIMRA